jgi:hypothetical protein
MSRPIGTPAELERRRRLAVERVRQGEKLTVVARILGVNRTPSIAGDRPPSAVRTAWLPRPSTARPRA